MTLSEFEFLAGTFVLDTRYKYLESQYNNPFYSFNKKIDFVLAHYFADSETIRCNINLFLINFLIKPIIKNLSYYNVDK